MQRRMFPVRFRSVGRSRFPAALLAVFSLLVAFFAPLQIGPTSALADDPVSIIINKFDCPSSYNHDYYQLAANCSPPNYQVQFQLYGPNFTQFYTGGISQNGLTAGVFTIREIVPSGYSDPLAFCKISDQLGNDSGSQEVVIYDGYLEQQVDAGKTLYCDWFNIPLQQASTSGTIIVNKHFCKGPDAFDAYDASIYDLAANCNEQATPVPFSAYQGNNKLQDGTSTGAPNLLTFSNLPTGAITIVEQIPDGYGDPIAYCSVKDGQGNDRAPVTQAPVDNDRINWTLNSGDVVFCDWFNVPAEKLVTISVVKYSCPDSIGYNWGGFGDYTQGCTSPASGISFKLDSASTGNPGNQETDGNGQASWTDLEADHYYITEEVPDGYQQPVVFCAFYLPNASPQNQDFQPYSVSDDNRIEFDIKGGQYIVCVWFNVSNTWTPASPTATSTPKPKPTTAPSSTATATSVSTKKPTLIIHLHVCDTGYDQFAQNADPKKDCTGALTDQASFKLGPLTGTGNGTTTKVDSSGTVTFANVTAGSYRLTDLSFPTGGNGFIKACTSTGRDLKTYPFDPFAWVDPTGNVALSLINGETLECDWYDVPAATAGAPGLTIQVYDCGSAQPSTANCTKIDFVAYLVLVSQDDPGNPQLLVTNGSGFAHVDGLDGVYTLTESGVAPCSIQSTDLDANGNLNLSPDKATTANVFNCS